MAPRKKSTKRVIQKPAKSAVKEVEQKTFPAKPPRPKREGKIRFFSPRASAMRIVITPQQSVVTQTPGGTIATMTPGKSAHFRDGVFETGDQEIIDYLTNKYSDLRFPIVREDMVTASARTQALPPLVEVKT